MFSPLVFAVKKVHVFQKLLRVIVVRVKWAKWPEMQGKDELLTAVQTQINTAKEYVDRALGLEKKGIDGVGKLNKRIRAELRFLTEVS